MAIRPPLIRIWWKEPIAKVEIIWVIVAFLWGLVMFFMMIYWHGVGKQNLSNEAYRQNPVVFARQAQALAEQYRVGEEGGIPVVRPPPGSDIYLIARLWQWWPIFELEKDKDYRLHVMSMDWQHGLSIQPVNLNLQIHPNYEMVITVTPDVAGDYGVICNEFCGIGHHTMVGKMYVRE